MTTLPSWTSVALQLLLITLFSAYIVFAQTCDCYTYQGSSCTSCYTGCYLNNRRCFKCPAGCDSCADWYNCDSCTEGYFGSSCQNSCSNCRGNKCNKDDGRCTDGCVDGYYSNTDWAGCFKCSTQCRTCTSWRDCTACELGFYGTSCSLVCSNCKYNTCYKDSGQCTSGCVDGYYQPQRHTHCARCPNQCFRCNSDTQCTACNTGYHGHLCGSKCDSNCKHGPCDLYSGVCTNGCVDGYFQNGTSCLPNCQIDLCQTCRSDNQACSVCQDGYYLFNGECSPCKTACLNGKCDKTDGGCTEGCDDGLTGRYCNDQCYTNCIACEQYNKETCTLCKPGYHSQKCEYECNTQCQEEGGIRQCAKDNGECTQGCANGYSGPTCSDKCSLNCLSCDQTDQWSCDTCKPGYYRHACDKECSSNCGMVNSTGPCDKDTGKCLVNCTQGYRGATCGVPCEAGCQNGCDRDTGTCDRCTTLYYGSSCEHMRLFMLQSKQRFKCGVQSGQESAAKSDNNGAIIGAATGSVIFVLIVMILVTVFIVMRRKRQKTSNPEPDGMEGNTDFVYSLPEKSRSSRKVESTALYVIPEKSTTVQPNSSNPAIYENGVYSNVEDRPSLPTIETVDATEDGLEEINQDDIDSGSLADNVYSMLDRADQDYITDYTTLNALAGQLQEGQANPFPPTDAQKSTYVNTDDISTGPAKDSYEIVIDLRV